MNHCVIISFHNLPTVEFSVSKNSKWIKANHEMKGFYRVQYTEENWKALINQLLENHWALSEADRANLLEDSFSLARFATRWRISGNFRSDSTGL